MNSLPCGERRMAKDRLRRLSSSRRRDATERVVTTERLSPASETKGHLKQLLALGGLRLHPLSFVALCSLLGLGCGWLSAHFLTPVSVPFFLAIGFIIPFGVLDRRIEHRARCFAEDYPAILLAASSSIKVGLTPENALQRATKLLPRESDARKEIELLLSRLREGLPKEAAVAAFAENYRLPDVDLFRSAFLLVMETGGRFSPTLQRLAGVSANRMTLLKMAEVSTASMRMTGNVLLCIAPGILGFLSMRIQGFWITVKENPIANGIASGGILMMVLGFLVLRSMSRFKP